MGPVEEAKGIDTMHTEDTELAGKDKERVEEPDVDEDEQYSVAEQRKIIHKVDRRLLIILGLMQAVSFLDRANLSNAAIAGMYEDLGLAIGNRYVSCSTPYDYSLGS